MSYTLEFEIAGLPKMTNTSRVHWRAKLRESQKWKSKVAMACLLGGKPAQPLASAVLSLTRVSSVEPDADGLVSGFKHVVDGLVECGVLVNDRPSNIGFPNYKWEKAPPNRGRVKVRVEET